MKSDCHTQRRTLPVLAAPIDAIDMASACRRIAYWAERRESRYVCICNAHSAVTTTRDTTFRNTIERADMATADGAPVAWMLRRLGETGQERVSGPDLMLRYLSEAQERNEAIGLYGSTPQTLELLRRNLLQRWPNLNIAYSNSPPFRPLSTDEDAEDVAAINASGARTLWVSLGCPKQENWMAAHVGRIDTVMIGVGAAFDFHAGTVARAPDWMQRNGLEWLHRLASEPRRLWRRYLVTNSLFAIGAIRQLLALRLR